MTAPQPATQAVIEIDTDRVFHRRSPDPARTVCGRDSDKSYGIGTLCPDCEREASASAGALRDDATMLANAVLLGWSPARQKFYAEAVRAALAAQPAAGSAEPLGDLVCQRDGCGIRLRDHDSADHDFAWPAEESAEPI